MSSITEDFRDLVAEVDDKIQETEIWDDWTPPCTPGGILYHVRLVSVDAGTRQGRDGKPPYAFIRLTYEVLDGEHQGRLFTIIYATYAIFACGPVLQLASLLNRDPSFIKEKKFGEVPDALAAFTGKAEFAIMGSVDNNGYKKWQTSHIIKFGTEE